MATDDDEDGDEPAERLAGQAEDVLDRPDEVRDERDRDQAQPDDQDVRGRDAAAGSAPAQPPDRDEDRRGWRGRGRRCAGG